MEFLIYYSSFYKYDYCHIKIYSFKYSQTFIILILKHIIQNSVVLSFKFM